MSLTKPVSAIMTITPVVANVSTEFSKVVRLFTEFPVHHLPIVDEDNKLIGMVSSNDLPKVFLELCNRNPKIAMDFDAIDKAIVLSDIMTSDPVTVSSSETIGNAAKIFADKKFMALPVVDDGILIGILSVKDVLAYIAD